MKRVYTFKAFFSRVSIDLERSTTYSKGIATMRDREKKKKLSRLCHFYRWIRYPAPVIGSRNFSDLSSVCLQRFPIFFHLPQCRDLLFLRRGYVVRKSRQRLETPVISNFWLTLSNNTIEISFSNCIRIISREITKWETFSMKGDKLNRE